MTNETFSIRPIGLLQIKEVFEEQLYQGQGRSQNRCENQNLWQPRQYRIRQGDVLGLVVAKDLSNH